MTALTLRSARANCQWKSNQSKRLDRISLVFHLFQTQMMDLSCCAVIHQGLQRLNRYFKLQHIERWIFQETDFNLISMGQRYFTSLENVRATYSRQFKSPFIVTTALQQKSHASAFISMRLPHCHSRSPQRLRTPDKMWSVTCIAELISPASSQRRNHSC